MSSRQRKRRGGALDSTRARKRSRLLPSSAGGTSQADPEGSGPLSFEPAGEEVIDLTGESSEPEVIVISDDESEVDSEQSQQQPHPSGASENSAEPLARNDAEEPRDVDDEWQLVAYSPPFWLDGDSEFLEVHEQQRRNVPLNSHEQVDDSGNGTGANDAPVADAAPAEQGAEEEATASSDAQQGVVIRCPICMDVYSEIVQSERQLVSTLCGHVFCSRCLPTALETAEMCPTCRVDLSPELYHPIYL